MHGICVRCGCAYEQCECVDRAKGATEQLLARLNSLDAEMAAVEERVRSSTASVPLSTLKDWRLLVALSRSLARAGKPAEGR